MDKYVVTCNCGGAAAPVAEIDDRREVVRRAAAMGFNPALIGDELIVRGIGPEDTAVQFAAADGERHGVLYRQAAQAWADYAVTETVWPDGNSTFTVRCAACKTQVQITATALGVFLDRASAARDKLPRIDGRHEIPIGVLCRYVAP
ncbi:hypothetical protein MSM1_17515 [Mycobacterium sp. SM1]|uniref:hypothetical protein n=1 Tax=Mycobacterium sp. SM1 TaxID=2816243 RepID=UPI001BCA6F3B|nr:hypothetical protein [Mycobacterium sp. SM1]MBS4730058.1 hypothetical protein [Mycobacterium sp. SM1]